MLSFFARRNPPRSRQLAVVDDRSTVPGASPARLGAEGGVDAAAGGHRTCLLAACAAGARATVLEMRCGENEACRLRALGLCEGASVDVVDTRHAMLLDVRGTRLALGPALTAGITVRPLTS